MAGTATLESAVDDAVSRVRSLSWLKPESEWLRANVLSASPVGIDRANGIIYGRVLAEKGPFKSPGRGEFDDLSLDKIVELGNANPNGLKSRFTHPGLSADGLGKFLGRDKNIRRDGDKVRGDLHLDRTALQTPPDGGKPLGVYVMDLAESDPGALGSSLVLRTDKEFRLSKDGVRAKDDKGEELPPLWRPTKLHAIDVVDDGDAVHGSFLGTELPDQIVRDVSAALDAQFSGCDRATIKARGTAFLDRYLDLKFGDDDMDTELNAKPKPEPKPTPEPAPKPQPQPTGELAAELAKLEKLREDIRKDAELARDEQRKAVATARQARISDFLDSRSKAGKIAPWELDESDPKRAHLSLRSRLLNLSAEPSIRVGDELRSPLDVELDAIDARPVRSVKERLRGKEIEGPRSQVKDFYARHPELSKGR